jgi:hypothetical protein
MILPDSFRKYPLSGFLHSSQRGFSFTILNATLTVGSGTVSFTAADGFIVSCAKGKIEFSICAVNPAVVAVEGSIGFGGPDPVEASLLMYISFRGSKNDLSVSIFLKMKIILVIGCGFPI